MAFNYSMSHSVLSLSMRQPNWLPAIDLVCTTLAALLWLVFPSWGPWPLVLAIVPWALRLQQTGYLTISTPLAVPLWVFMITAVVALWAAHNPSAAWAKFWLLIASMLLFYTLANQPPKYLWLIAKLLSLLAVFIAAYFLLTHDWQADPTHMRLLDGLAERWMRIRPSLNLPALHPNQAAGFIVVLAPLGFVVGWRHWRNWSTYKRGIAGIAAALAMVALLLTGSRGAWLALAAAMTLWAWSPLSSWLARIINQEQRTIFKLGMMLAFAAILAVLLLFPQVFLSVANRLPGAASADSRATIFSNTMHLLGDFPFTGGGLDTFAGLYSQYILVIPQKIFTYAHNLFLDVALEQGILGLVALSTMLIGSLWLLSTSPDHPEAKEHFYLLRWAVATGLVIMIGRGLVDDAFYGNRGTPLLWLLPGLTAALTQIPTSRSFPRLPLGQWVFIPLLLLFLVAVTLVYSPWRATWFANLGAVQMARVELVDWPTNEWADGRYIPALESSEKLFRQALETYPNNRTALYRLGMIAILRRDFETAVAHLETALQADNSHIGIRKSLAYSYLWAGQFDDAQSLLATIPEARNELKIYAWWWGTQKRDDLAHYSEQMFNQLRAKSK
jgi:hypothetical protein